MKGKHLEVPFGLVFKKYYCCFCGNKLVKHKTHRVVSKGDTDYFQYQDYNMFPRTDHDVYSYELKCEHCKKNISPYDQYIIERIQKKYHKKILTYEEIKTNYYIEQEKDNSRSFKRNFIISIVFLTAVFFIIWLLMKDKSFKMSILIFIIYLFLLIYIIITEYRSFEGIRHFKINKDYSHIDKRLCERLHAYCTNNKELVLKSEYCYCFYCKAKIPSSEITKYIDNKNTALCPHCENDAILPDSIETPLNDSIIDNMNKFWF